MKKRPLHFIKNLWFHQKEIDEKGKKAAILGVFQRLAATEDGLIGISIILEDLYAFAPSEGADSRALKDYSSFFIRERLGATDGLAITQAIIETVKGD